MKKLLIILLLSAISAMAEDLVDYYKSVQNELQTAKEAERLVNGVIYLESTKSPEILATSGTAKPNTYLWYIFKDFGQSTGFEKLANFEILQSTITKEK